jgi:hypothetical protein
MESDNVGYFPLTFYLREAYSGRIKIGHGIPSTVATDGEVRYFAFCMLL